MIRRAVLICCVLCMLSALGARAVEVSDTLSRTYHLERYSVLLNAEVVSRDCTVYVDEDETIYVASDDLDAWGLKRPRMPAFEREGRAYFGLQSDLRLAASIDSQTHELNIVAPSSSFRGQRSAAQPVDYGRGTFLNYTIARENGRYDLFAAGNGGVFEARYLSTAGDGGVEFHRSLLRWYRLNQRSHSVIALGDNTSDGGWLGISAPFAGVHYATDYTSDPQYVPHAPPAVSGFATSPSLLEVYVDSILELRTNVPAGPFTVGDLPASAAHADIVMVLTDAGGKQTIQVARPSYEPDILGRGFSQFRIDAGVAHANLDSRGQYYGGGVAQTGLAYGLTDNITANVLGESISGETFFAGGADIQLSRLNQLGFRIGGGNRRRASEYRYRLRSGNVSLQEDFAYNSMRSEPIPEFDDADVVAQLSERSSLNVNIRNVSLSLGFTRTRTSIGSNQSALSARASYRAGMLSVDLAPFYDFISHRTSADLSFNLRLDDRNSLVTKSAVTSTGDTSEGFSWHSDSSGPNHDLSTDVNVSANASQDRGAQFEDRLPWAQASFAWQQQNGSNVYEPSLQGALAFLGSGVYAIRRVDDNESFGVLRIPGLRNVRVKVNSAPAGATNRKGDLLLRDLLPYAQNDIDIEQLPISYHILRPLRVVPGKTAPVAIVVREISHGGITFDAVDDRGLPLPAGSWVDGEARYPVGYGGRVFVAGISPGTHRLRAATSSGHACTMVIRVPKDVDDVPDLGTQRCASH